MEDEKDFKVIDRRFSANAKDEPKDKASDDVRKGEGFVMKNGETSSSPYEVDFSTFLLSLATGALIHLGLAPDPMTKKTQKNVELAKQNIEILALLQKKTKGNLTPDEDKLMESLLTEVRLRFVDASR